MSTFPDAVRNAWHLVALSRDVKRGQVRQVVLLDTPIALFRNKAGLGALVDRCPHRNYPLSQGKLRGGALACPYHGWRFANDGTCVDVPGCALDHGDPQRLAAKGLRVVERHGGIFIALSDEAPAEPVLPAVFGDPDLDHFWWQGGTWQGRAIDAVENLMDPFHTAHLHHGLIRHRSRRQPVQFEVESDGNSLTMTILQGAPDLGLMARVLERERSRSISTYLPPNVVQGRWESDSGLTLCVNSVLTPVSASSFMPFAHFSTRKGLAPGWFKQMAIRLFLWPILKQDRDALQKQSAVMQHFGHPRFATGPGDVLGDRLYRLWKGDGLEPGKDPPVAAEL